LSSRISTISFVQACPRPTSLQFCRTRSPAGAPFGFSPHAFDWNLKDKGVCPGCGLPTNCTRSGSGAPGAAFMKVMSKLALPSAGRTRLTTS
jgi:hypothetical protein